MTKLVFLVVALAFVAHVSGASPDNARDVRNAVLGFSAAWNQHDMVALGKLFAPDADFVNVAGIRLKGRQQIQMVHAWAHGAIPESTQMPGADRAHYGIFKHSTLKFTDIAVRFLRKDVAIVDADSELLGDARTPNPRRTVLTLVLVRQNGGWLIASAQNTEINRTVR